MMSVPDTTARAIRKIADDTGLEEPVVRVAVEAYVEAIKQCLKEEIPFTIRGIGRIHHKYANRPTEKHIGPDGEKKVKKTVALRLSPDGKALFEGWVHDLGISTNNPSELLKIKLKPEEIAKVRRRRILADQRSLGFRSDLLFDEPHQQDALIEKEFEDSPTVDQITTRIGINLDGD